jgi:uncharacterized protein YndB with AHSA1/START domain
VNAIANTTPDAIVTEIEIAAPPARVFAALTEAKQLARWWTNEDCQIELWEMDARLGGHWRFKTKPSATVSVNGVNTFEAQGEILEIDPPRLLVYTWIANWHNRRDACTIVRWELAPSDKGTRVKVTHSGLANLPVARKDYSGGWPGVVEMLKKFVEN